MGDHEKELDIIEELERLDAFYDGTEPGERPIDVLRGKGIVIPNETDLDDAAVTERLWVVINAMAEIGMFLESTDHLSDRELYRYLVTSALIEETILPSGASGAWHINPIGGCSEEDLIIYHRYYADDEMRQWAVEDGDVLPPHEEPPYDRDRLLPQHHFPLEADA